LGKTPIQFTIPRTKPQADKDKDKQEEEIQEEQKEQEERDTRFVSRGGYYGGWYGWYGWYYYPVIVTHSSYHSTYHGMGRPHPAHFHGVGGFFG
jgi:hypothetical protein